MTISPTQELLLELLAARHRLGEHIWSLTANGPTKKALTALEASGLVSWKNGIVEGTYLARLTDAGKAEYMSADYTSPMETTVRNQIADDIEAVMEPSGARTVAARIARGQVEVDR